MMRILVGLVTVAVIAVVATIGVRFGKNIG